MTKIIIPKRPKKPTPMQVPCTAESKKKIAELAISWCCTYVEAVTRILSERDSDGTR